MGHVSVPAPASRCARSGYSGREEGRVKVIGRDIGDVLDERYQALERRLREEAGRELKIDAFEQDALSNVRWGDETVTVRLHKGVPTHALLHVFAFALERVRQRVDRYPDVRRPAGDQPEEARAVRQSLRELVLAPEAEMQLAPIELDQQWEVEQRHSAMKEMLRDPPQDWGEAGSGGNSFMALQYARFRLQHPPEMWEGLKKAFQEQLPVAAEGGERVLRVIRETGWGTPGACLQSLVAARDELGLRDIALIEDRRTGEFL